MVVEAIGDEDTAKTRQDFSGAKEQLIAVYLRNSEQKVNRKNAGNGDEIQGVVHIAQNGLSSGWRRSGGHLGGDFLLFQSRSTVCIPL